MSTVEYVASGREGLARIRLTRGQRSVLGAAGVLMAATGAFGAWGTYTNAAEEMGRSATAAGMVAAGEGATLILALVMVGLTLLGQAAPVMVRLGLWLAPLAAAGVGIAIADDVTEMVVYGMSPMGMCVAAEGLGLMARRVVIYATGVDAEAQRRTADAVRELAYHQAAAARHPDEKTRRKANLKAWKTARQVGVGDTVLGAELVSVQRQRLTQGADAALVDMFGAVTPPAVTAGPAPVTPALEEPVTPAVTPGVTESVTPDGSRGVTEGVTPEAAGLTGVSSPEAEGVDTASRERSTQGVTLEEIAAVTGVPTPEPYEPLTDAQLLVVLRWLRYSEDPPMSYRQAQKRFRELGYVGGERRVRQAWRELAPSETEDSGV